MKLSIKLSAPGFHYGQFGLLDLTLSFYRDRPARWRQVTIGLRSPILVLTGESRRLLKKVWAWNRPRFGRLATNYYFGVLYILDSKRGANLSSKDERGRYCQRYPYRKFGPIEFVWDDGMARLT
jgi:hypothetical protein